MNSEHAKAKREFARCDFNIAIWRQEVHVGRGIQDGVEKCDFDTLRRQPRSAGKDSGEIRFPA